MEQLEECGQPTDFSVAYGCRSVNSAFIGDYVSFRGVNERLEPDELRALLKERYQEYQIAFCTTESMDPDPVREAVEKSRHRFYSFRGSDGQRRSHDTLLLVPYIAGVGLMDKGSISLETMYYLLKEYEIRVDGEPDHFIFQGINEKQYEFSESFVCLDEGYRCYYYLEDGKERLFKTDTTAYISSELLLETAGIGIKAAARR